MKTKRSGNGLKDDDESLKTEILEKRFEFIYAAFEDARDTIRALDQKVNFLFFGLAIPLSGLTKILATSKAFYALPLGLSPWLIQVPVLFAFVFAWAGSFYMSLKILASSESPANHISNDAGASGVFFSAKLFKADFRDLFANRKSLRSTLTVVQNQKRFEISPERIFEELVFEHMKLVYLRDVKRLRQIWAYRLFFIWIVLGGLIWASTLIFKEV